MWCGRNGRSEREEIQVCHSSAGGRWQVAVFLGPLSRLLPEGQDCSDSSHLVE